MADVYVVVHLATTHDDAHAPRDSAELLELAWCTVDAHTLLVLPRQHIRVLPTHSAAGAQGHPLLAQAYAAPRDGVPYREAVAQFDQRLSAELAGRDFTFVTLDVHQLRVLLPREARDKLVVLPVYLQHPRVFDLYNEYLKWQATHPEAMSYPSSCLANMVTALGVAGPLDDNVDVHAAVLVQLVKKLVPVEAHPTVLTKPYDTAHDAKIFLAERSKILYLSNLSPDTTQSELELWFTQYGGRPIAFWTLKNADADNKNPKRGIAGFAVFAKHEDAAELLYMNGRALSDRVVEVQASLTRVLDRAAELLTPFPPLKNRPRPGDWTCPSCGFSNFQRRIACFRCLFPATSAVAIQEQMYTPDRRLKDDKQPLPSYYNDQYHKNAGGYGYGHNYAGGQRALYGNSVPFRAGDWKCTNELCQYHNFAKNLCCLKCGGAKPALVGMHASHSHNNSAAAAAAAAAAGSVHMVNTTAAAIAAATASGQPLNFNNSYLGLHQPQPHQRGQSLLASSSPVHSMPQMYQGKQGSTQLPQHLALLQGQGLRHKNSQLASSSPGLYVQNLGYQYKNGEGLAMLSSQINSLSLNNTGA